MYLSKPIEQLNSWPLQMWPPLLENEDNTHKLSKELIQARKNIILLEDHLLEAGREEVKLKHDYDAILVDKRMLEILAQYLHMDKDALIT